MPKCVQSFPNLVTLVERRRKVDVLVGTVVLLCRWKKLSTFFDISTLQRKPVTREMSIDVVSQTQSVAKICIFKTTIFVLRLNIAYVIG